MPGRHSLFWRLVVLVAGFCLLMIAATHYVGQSINRQTSVPAAALRTALALGGGTAGLLLTLV